MNKVPAIDYESDAGAALLIRGAYHHSTRPSSQSSGRRQSIASISPDVKKRCPVIRPSIIDMPVPPCPGMAAEKGIVEESRVKNSTNRFAEFFGAVQRLPA